MKNEHSPAVGNIRVNARGDEIGPGGKIVRTREEVISEYYQHQEPSEVKFREKAVADSEQQDLTKTKKTKTKPGASDTTNEE